MGLRLAAAYGGTNYQNAISGWVKLITENGMVVIVDLHWTALQLMLSNAQEPMADADHAPTVWSRSPRRSRERLGHLRPVQRALHHGLVLLGQRRLVRAAERTNYTVAGMAALLQAVRNAGAQNVVILGGLSASSDMSQWVSSVNGIPTPPVAPERDQYRERRGVVAR